MKIYSTILAFLILRILSAQKIWSFNDCLSYAKENNLQVLAAILNEKVQEGNYDIAKKNKLPNLTGTAGNSFSFGPDARKDFSYNEGYQNNLALESSIILYNNGSLDITQEKNKLLIDQYKFTTEKIRNDISLQLVGNYLTVLLNKELMLVNGNLLNTQIQDAERNEKLYNAGSIPLSTLYESKSNMANAKQTFENSKIDVNRALMNLAMLLQMDYRDFEIEDVKVSDQIDLPLINIDNIINHAYTNQPEIKSSELSVEVAKKDIELAKAALYPTITGGYKASTYYQDYFDRSVKNLKDQWHDNNSQIITLGVSVPIFNKGITKAKIEQSKIAQLIQENQLDQNKLNLKQTIQSSYFDVNSSYQTYTSAKELVESTKISYEFAEKSFNAGKINVYDLNIARTNYFNAQSQMLQAKYSYLFKLKILEFYMGKPLEISSDENINTNNTLTTSISQSIHNTKISLNETNSNESLNVNTNNDNNIIANEPKEVNILQKNSEIVDLEDNLKSESINKKTIEKNIPINESEKIISNDHTETANIPKKDQINQNSQTIANSSLNEEDLKREALIKERRAKLSQGSSTNIFKNEAEREEMIKKKREEMKKN